MIEKTPIIEIDMDRPCTACGQMGAMPNGKCLECASESIVKQPTLLGVNQRFLKIKVETKDFRDRIRLEFEKKNGQAWDEFMMNSNDKPAPSFHVALQALAQDVLEMCELPLDYRERIVVKGVSFSYGGEKEVMGVTITATMRLMDSNVPLNLNTPHKAEEPYAETGDPKQLLDPACVRRILALSIEAEQFIRGVRLQTDMFAGKAA